MKDLALKIRFAWNPHSRKTWWGLPSEKEYKCGNKKSELIHEVLQVTKD